MIPFQSKTELQYSLNVSIIEKKTNFEEWMRSLVEYKNIIIDCANFCELF